MNSKIFALIGLLLVTSCDTQPNVRPPVGDSTGLGTDGVLKSQEAIATEILSIQYTVGDAMFQLNNTNAIGFVAKVEPLADRLEKISKELDALGPFPAGLRDATIKKLDDAEKALAQVLESKKASGLLQHGLLQPEAAKIVDPVSDKYFSAWASVMMKAGLDIEAKSEASGMDANSRGKNKP